MMDRANASASMGVMGLLLACGTASAAPEVLDLVPEDAAVIVTVGEIADFANDIEAVAGLIGDNVDPEMMMVAENMRNTRGIHPGKSAAFFVPRTMTDAQSGEASFDPDEMLVLIPVTNFGVLTGGSSDVDGATPFELDGRDLFARDLGGGYAVMGQSGEMVRAFEPGQGRTRAHRARLGSSGLAIVNDAEITIIVDMDPFRDSMLEGLQSMQQQAAFLAAMSGAGAEAAGSLNQLGAVIGAHITDARTGVFGVSFDDKTGLALDMGVQFNDDTESARVYDHAGDAASLLGRLPRDDFFFAFAADTRAEGFTKLATALADAGEQGGAGDMIPGLAQAGEMGTGTAGIVGANPAFMMTGLLSNSVLYVRSDDTAPYAQSVRDAIESVDGLAAEGVSLATTIAQDEREIEGVTVDAYSVRMTPDGSSPAGGMPVDPRQMIQTMFGPTLGPAGYIAEVEGGVVQTMGRNTKLAGRAIGAASTGEGLATHSLVKSVSDRLPEHRVAEIYIGFDQLLNSTGPLLMMGGLVERFEPVDDLEPIALGLSTMGGGVHGRIVMPQPVIQEIIELMPEQEELEWAPTPADEDEDEDGGLDF